MKSSSTGRVHLIDSADGPGRTTATLIASLAARFAALHAVSGADAIGSLTAGFAALGRAVSQTAEGARLLKAMKAGRVGTNGKILWTTLRVDEWASTMPPSPILDQLRNDLALLLADDLQATLELMPIPPQPAGARGHEQIQPVTFEESVLGLWAFSREMLRAVELLAAPTMPPAGEVTATPQPDSDPESALLR